tara:strand:+ start:3354 stop:4010 length:657 start_codon:yes stop_codon:yes gene_type:complete
MSLVEEHALLPDDIDKGSIGMVTAKLIENGWEDDSELFVASRIVRAEGDINISEFIKFSDKAISKAIEALSNKKTIVTDVRMVQVGISEALLNEVGVSTICKINTTEVADRARADNTTRSIANIRELKTYLDDAILCVGNAPTALLEILDLIRAKMIRPAMVIGMPVGFIACAESKYELTQTEVEYITVTGNRGGSSAAAATVNALALLALDQKKKEG